MTTRKEIELFESRMLAEAEKWLTTYKLGNIKTLEVTVSKDLERHQLLGDVEYAQDRKRMKALEIRLNPRVMRMSKKEQVDQVRRQLVIYKLWIKTGKKFTDGATRLDRELHQEGLTLYRSVPIINGVRPQIPKKLYTIVCSNCHKIYGLYIKKLPERLDITKQYHKRTPCCKAPFYDAGWVEYTPKELIAYKAILESGGVLAADGN